MIELKYKRKIKVLYYKKYRNEFLKKDYILLIKIYINLNLKKKRKWIWYKLIDYHDKHNINHRLLIVYKIKWNV